MSKIVTIPTDGGNPFVVILGGIKYVYKPGETVEVPDGVALEIEEWERWHEKYYGDNVPPFGAGGDTQPDWNQNDQNAADYVKNRTHYEEFKTIIEEREVRVWFDGGGFDASRMPQVGEKLTVTLNGETYECVVWEIEGNIGLGNGEAFNINKGENVPFFAGFEASDEAGPGALILTTTIGENTISIVDNSGNTLLEETFNTEMNVDGPMYSGDFPLDQPLIVGNTYKVVYDGVPYECVAWDGSGDICLGNGEMDGYDHIEDVPFMICTYFPNNGLVWYLCFNDNDSHTVSVSGAVVKKLDPKYLPSPEAYLPQDIIDASWKAENAEAMAENANAQIEQVSERVTQLDTLIDTVDKKATDAKQASSHAMKSIGNNKILRFYIEAESLNVGETITTTDAALETYDRLYNGYFTIVEVQLYTHNGSRATSLTFYIQQHMMSVLFGITQHAADNTIFALCLNSNNGSGRLTRIA